MVCVTLMEGLVDKHIQMLRAHRLHEYFSLLQVLRHDLWTAVQHLSVSFEDIWMYMAPVHELTSSVDRTPLSKNVLPRSAAVLGAGMDALVLVVVVRAQQRFDQCVLVTSLQAACQGGPSLFRRSTDYLSGLFKHVNNSYILSSRLLSCDTGPALSASDRGVLQHLEYVTSANKLEDAIMSGSAATTSATGGGGSGGGAAAGRHVYEEYDPAGPNFDPHPKAAQRLTMSDVHEYFAMQARRRDEEEVKKYHAAQAAEALIQRNITAANTRSRMLHDAASSSRHGGGGGYDADVSQNMYTGRKIFDLTAGRRLSAPTAPPAATPSSTPISQTRMGPPPVPPTGSSSSDIITTTATHVARSIAAPFAGGGVANGMQRSSGGGTRPPSPSAGGDAPRLSGASQRRTSSRMYAPSFDPEGSPTRRHQAHNNLPPNRNL